MTWRSSTHSWGGPKIRGAIPYVNAAVTAARSQGWLNQANEFRNKAYGDPSHPEELALIDIFFMGQVLVDQRIPRRQLPFRDKRYKFGGFLLG